jgi:hypothetical protein
VISHVRVFVPLIPAHVSVYVNVLVGFCVYHVSPNEVLLSNIGAVVSIFSTLADERYASFHTLSTAL